MKNNAYVNDESTLQVVAELFNVENEKFATTYRHKMLAKNCKLITKELG